MCFDLQISWIFDPSVTIEKCCFVVLDTLFFLRRRKALLEHFENLSLHPGRLLPASVCAHLSYHLPQ